MKQKPRTPPIADCWCGAKAVVVDWDYIDMWRVWCDNNHTLTQECGSPHRAICLWNNRIAERSAKSHD